jgi:IPT/TIG domain/PASTA domain
VKKLAATVLGVLLACALLAPAAPAQITLGQMAPGTAPAAICNTSPYDMVPGAVASGNGYAAPTAGVLTSWSTNAAAGAGQDFDLKVFRPVGPGEFLVLARDTRSLSPAAVNTFQVSIPVRAGDLIGAQDANAGTVHNACEFATGSSADSTLEHSGDVQPGDALAPSFSSPGFLPNITATLLPPPTIAALKPASASIEGGTTVTISGSDFADVSAVTFGSAPARSYTVASEGAIAAVAPASKTLGAVGVTVTTAAGAATSPTVLTYTACVVPRLRGRKLAASRQELKKADCKLGKVTRRKGATAKGGRVAKQSPKPGQLLAPGAKVKLTLAG